MTGMCMYWKKDVTDTLRCADGESLRCAGCGGGGGYMSGDSWCASRWIQGCA